jgi:hypothetical protein
MFAMGAPGCLAGVAIHLKGVFPVKLFNTRRPRREQVSLADTAAVVNAAMQLQDELANLTDDELELWHWGAQHITGFRMCGGTLTVSGYLAILRQIRDSEQLR